MRSPTILVRSFHTGIGSSSISISSSSSSASLSLVCASFAGRSLSAKAVSTNTTISSSTSSAAPLKQSRGGCCDCRLSTGRCICSPPYHHRRVQQQYQHDYQRGRFFSSTNNVDGNSGSQQPSQNPANEQSFISGLSYMNRGGIKKTPTPAFSPSDDSDDVQIGTNPVEVASELLDFADHIQSATGGGDNEKDTKAQKSLSAYQSPMQSFFDDMYGNGPTTMGTTNEMLKYEQNVAAEQKILSCGIPERKLRFTTTSYGRTTSAPFVHNNEHRVICKVNVNDLPFKKSSNEYEILQQVVGEQRLQDDTFRLTSNHFGSRIENKRHLVSMMDRIILSCQRIASELPSATTNGSLSPPPPPTTTTTTTTAKTDTVEVGDAVTGRNNDDTNSTSSSPTSADSTMGTIATTASSI